MLAFNIMKGFTVERNPRLSTVGKLLFNPVNFMNIKEFTLLFTTYRSYGLRPSLTKAPFVIMKCSALWRNAVHVKYVGRPFTVCKPLEILKNTL
jgi:hypothetical protein